MKAAAEHRLFLNKRGYRLHVSNEGIFSREELRVLERYGFWLEALAGGKISPITAAQEQFVKVCKGEAPRETLFERAWMRLVERRELEPDLAREFDVTDRGEEWFQRGAHWRYH